MKELMLRIDYSETHKIVGEYFENLYLKTTGKH